MKSSQTPKLEHIEQVSEGWLNKYILTFREADGSEYVYESISRKKLETYRAEMEAMAAGEAPRADGVCIVPVLPDGSLVLIHEFRYALNTWVVGLPAGLMEPGESIETCVARELGEETGYRLCSVGEEAGAAVVSLPQAGFSSTGMTEESVNVAFARVEPAGEATPETNELVEPFVLPASDIKGFLAENTMPIGVRAQLILEMFTHVDPLSIFE